MDYDKARELFDYDPASGELMWRASSKRAGSSTTRGYRTLQYENKEYREHRVIWLWVTGAWPVDQIDHINRKRDDNRWANLREASNSDNQRNRTLQQNNTSGVPGVAWHERDKRWRARIKVAGKYLNLGGFKTFEEAALARWEAEIQHGFSGEYGAAKSQI